MTKTPPPKNPCKPPGTKPCTKCHVTKPATTDHFWRTGRKARLGSRCIECENVRHRAYRARRKAERAAEVYARIDARGPALSGLPLDLEEYRLMEARGDLGHPRTRRPRPLRTTHEALLSHTLKPRGL